MTGVDGSAAGTGSGHIQSGPWTGGRTSRSPLFCVRAKKIHSANATRRHFIRWEREVVAEAAVGGCTRNSLG